MGRVASPFRGSTACGAFLGASILCGLFAPALEARADQTSLQASQDNAIYSESDNSFGAGPCLPTGRNGFSHNRRILLAFDLSSIPPGVSINSATLKIYLINGPGGAPSISVYRLLQGWGEGNAGEGVTTCGGGGAQGNGEPSSGGAATWNTPALASGQGWDGGDFDPNASASVPVYASQEGQQIEWSGTGITEDVKSWIDHPTDNHGWILIGNETTPGTVRQFASRENPDLPHPTLTVFYTIPTGACCKRDGSCVSLTEQDCAAQGGAYQGDAVDCGAASCPIVLEPYVDALPIPSVAVPVRGLAGHAAWYEMPMREFKQSLHRDLPPTTLWGYNGEYPGPTIEAASNEPVRVKWINDLRDEFGQLRTRHYFQVDTRIHGPDAAGQAPRTVVHLHGAHVHPEYDGYPESTFVAGQSRDYVYANTQRACTLWYHDHSLGITRYNVMMGLAGFYLIREQEEERLGLPEGPYEIPLLVQDRKFNSDGSLSYPAQWTDDFMGDKVLVNGKVWPFLQVAQGKYRFRFLNGSNHRIYTFALSDHHAFHVIGTDGGLLGAPVRVTQITMAPAERADVVVDFAGYAAGSEVLLQNLDPSPTGPDSSARKVMKFVVTQAAGWTDLLPHALRPLERIPEGEAVRTRTFELTQVADPVTGTRFRLGGLDWGDISEYPVVGSTEIWSFVNRTGLTHPMHIHLVQFQVLDRQRFTEVNGQVLPTGPRMPPSPEEAGYKDTAKIPPGEILRVIARFTDYAGEFVFHCHMLEHEDNDMMRQFTVVPRSSTTPACAAVHAEPSRLWPPDQQLAQVRIVGATDADGQPLSVHITGITQDESVTGQPQAAGSDSTVVASSPGTPDVTMQEHQGSACIDARIDGLSLVSLRRARQDGGNGRVYRIAFTAVDGKGGTCEGSVPVSVPVSEGTRIGIDDGQIYNSIAGCVVTSSAHTDMESLELAASPTSFVTSLESARVEGPNAVVQYTLARAGEVSLAIFDVAGRRVVNLDNAVQEAGRHKAALALRGVTRGVYFARLRVGGKSYTRRLMLLGSGSR